MDVRNPKPLSRNTIIWFINELLNTTGVRVSPVMTEGMMMTKHIPQRTTVMQCHGFRKYFMTTCINAAGMSPIYTDMLMGHDLGLTGAYTKLTG